MPGALPAVSRLVRVLRGASGDAGQVAGRLGRQVPPGQFRRWFRLSRSGPSALRGEGTDWVAARVSRRMMSMVTRWDQRGLRVTRASRA